MEFFLFLSFFFFFSLSICQRSVSVGLVSRFGLGDVEGRRERKEKKKGERGLWG